eukprot:403358207
MCFQPSQFQDFYATAKITAGLMNCQCSYWIRPQVLVTQISLSLKVGQTMSYLTEIMQQQTIKKINATDNIHLKYIIQHVIYGKEVT